ncbi:type I methionyl aminopeptidase [Candidatus Uhrbacteria bacterium]|nr:type I methionyl aminopeptidase [Candidatus Uhrbacteria bacterium]
MALIKTPEEIKRLKRGGALLSDILRHVAQSCRVGTSTAELDRMVRREMEKAGGEPSFLGYRISPDDPPYPCAVCISVNEEVVHGLAIPEHSFHDGDIVSLDLGMWYEGLATDMATTVLIGDVRPEVRRLVADTRDALVCGLKAVKAGAMVSDIGAAIEDRLLPGKYGIIRDLVGHGVGHEVHEEPQIPNYREPRAPRFRLEEGMVLAIEPMVALGSWKIRMKDDGWTIVTKDGSPAAHFEVTVAVTKKGYDLITPWPDRES